MPLLGSHLSIAGGMVNALHEARRLKMDCVQVFTKNQRQWKAPALKDAERAAWLNELQRMKWSSAAGEPHRVISHNSYLVNLASPDAELRKRSIAAQRDELERCEALDIRLCVAHPGAHLSEVRPVKQPNDLSGQPTQAEIAGLKRIALSLDIIHHDLPGYKVITCLETTVGSGTNLGYDFHHLALIRSEVKQPERVGFCLDTCHVTAAGYDMSTPAKAREVLDKWHAICGLDRLLALHLNDSVGPLGSRKDRHAHIGDGCCGAACFRTILNHPALEAVPMILETPKETNDKGVEWDVINLRRLRRMRARASASR
jgi:deoxyribonuclease-4